MNWNIGRKAQIAWLSAVDVLTRPAIFRRYRRRWRVSQTQSLWRGMLYVEGTAFTYERALQEATLLLSMESERKILSVNGIRWRSTQCSDTICSLLACNAAKQ